MASSSNQAVQVPESQPERAEELSTERPVEQQAATERKPFVIKVMTIVPN